MNAPLPELETVDSMNAAQLFEFLRGLEIPEGHGWVFRKSTTGRGWRLHTSTQHELEGKPVYADPRTAIKEYIKHELEVLDFIDRVGG